MRLRTKSQLNAFVADLAGVLTIRECAALFKKHPQTVRLQVITGGLYAEKADADEGVHGGVWLISFQSAIDLWGEPDVVDTGRTATISFWRARRDAHSQED